MNTVSNQLPDRVTTIFAIYRNRYNNQLLAQVFDTVHLLPALEPRHPSNLTRLAELQRSTKDGCGLSGDLLRINFIKTGDLRLTTVSGDVVEVAYFG